MAESREELKSLLMRVKEESEIAGLKLNIQKTKIMASSPITSWQTDEGTGNSERLYFLGLQNHCRWWLKPWKPWTPRWWRLLLGRKAMTHLDSILKSRHYFVNKGPSSQSYGFSSSHVRMWELDYKESWAPKNWCFWTVVLEKTLKSLLDCKEIKPVNPKGNQTWIFIGKTQAEAETLILWSSDVKSQLIRKDPDVGKDWRQEEKGMTEDKMVGWHHWLSGHEQAPGDGEGQGSLACCSPWSCKELDMTEQLNNNILTMIWQLSMLISIMYIISNYYL